MEINRDKSIYNIKRIFPLVDILLEKYDSPKVYSRDPSIDIEVIAQNCGIDSIVKVPKEEIENKHAIFENGILKIALEDPKEKQVFSIAHEIGHIALGHIDITADYKVARHGDHGKNALIFQIVRDKDIVINDVLQQFINEDLADYFAANLLVPMNRYLLWEDRSDQEIARAFGVEVKCIKRRRQEIANDLPALAVDTMPIG
ncbi:hypothetical protein FACS1894151_09710 [Spirochaetia bacterium]|nr:hypothetical protein FACS1894151_09710 [Spirochaetia bacterium]